MPPGLLFVLIVISSLFSWPIEAAAPISNFSVIGAVFCDACSSNTFSKHSYFLPGAKVLVECKFRPNSTSREDISVTAYRMTDSIGIYRLDIPPVDGFDCREGREIESACRASLVGSSSSLCNVPGLSSSTEHVAVKCKEASICVFNLNALNYRPSKKDATLCGTSSMQLDANFNTSLFFWPPFGFPWPKWLPFPFPSPPSLPFPFPSPPSLPFPFPPIPFFTPPPSFTFPFPFTPAPGPPAFPIPLPPSLFPPSPPPPTFPFPFPPLPPLPSFPPLFAQPPPPPPPPPPTIPIPFPPLPPLPPLFPSPGHPSPPPAFSLSDPRTWFPFYPPIPKDQPHYQKP